MGRSFSRASAALSAPVVLSALLASGCMGSPTYGTSRTANAQLTNDITGMFSMKPQKSGVDDYKPRPDLVKPASTLELPPPQDNVTTASNGAWPESPEEKRARLLTEIEANDSGNTAEPLIVNDISVTTKRPTGLKTAEQLQNDDAKPMSKSEAMAKRKEFKTALAETATNPSKRKYLSEPPVEYRQPAETAQAGDVGEDEADKAKRIKKQATKQTGWRKLIPWL